MGAHNCADPTLLYMNLWIQGLRTVKGKSTIVEAWHVDGSTCYDPSEAGQIRRALTWTTIRTAVRNISIPAAVARGPDFTLVNLRTTFYTTRQPIRRTLHLLGYTVDVIITPSHYTWHWGDETTTTSNRPGRPYPAHTVTHTYTHHTAPGDPRELRVDTTYLTRYRVDGSAWQRLPGDLTIPGVTRGLPVRRASTVLVAGN